MNPFPATNAGYEPCPDCGHFVFQHAEQHFWEDGHTCTKCSSHGGGRGLGGSRPPEYLCCLTSSEVRAAIAAGSPSCPNHDDPVLCKWDPARGALVPEAGCALHDTALHPTQETA